MKMWRRFLAGMLLFLGGVACTPEPIVPTATPTDVPTVTPVIFPTLPPAFTPTPSASATPTPLVVDALAGISVEPPLTLTLPSGWKYGYDTILFQEVGEVVSVPIALYQGEVEGGKGTIVLIWNFRSITTGNPFSSDYGTPNLWIDGLRLLRSLVFEATCNIGTEPQREYQVGGLLAVGTSFAVVDCPETPNTRGWFSALTVDDINFAFYVYTDPINAIDGNAKHQLQAILDSIIFNTAQFKLNP